MRIEHTLCASICALADLGTREHWLVRKACQVREKAQAPYSKYHVGAALFAQDDPVHGRMFIGCNVERATYTQTTHAEQNAIDSMVAELGPRKIAAMAIIGGHANFSVNLHPTRVPDPSGLTWDQLGAPSCGHCLQCIWENCMGDPTVRLLWNLPSGLIAITTIGNAFPIRFGPQDLGITP